MQEGRGDRRTEQIAQTVKKHKGKNQLEIGGNSKDKTDLQPNDHLRRPQATGSRQRRAKQWRSGDHKKSGGTGEQWKELKKNTKNKGKD